MRNCQWLVNKCTTKIHIDMKRKAVSRTCCIPLFILWVLQEELEKLLSEQGQLAITMEAEIARTEASCRDLDGDVQVGGFWARGQKSREL